MSMAIGDNGEVLTQCQGCLFFVNIEKAPLKCVLLLTASAVEVAELQAPAVEIRQLVFSPG